MNQGELTQESRENALLNLYQNQGYQTERVERKSLLVVIEQDSSVGSENDVTTFSFNLQEPLKIDKLSDMYLDSFTTLNCVQGDTTTCDATGFILKLDQFNINTVTTPHVGTTAQKLFNSIFIPNESKNGEEVKSVVVHKSKKFNYICNVNPTKIYTISGSITILDGTSPVITSGEVGRIIAEFVFISRN
tara:strand:- start:29 stop:598 length:570 start_codon:yes stop_codon:yes gene_type:complete